MFRHDWALSGRSAGQGAMTSPALIAATNWAAGQENQDSKVWIEDVNQDGFDEWIAVEGGRIKCRDKAGSVLWLSDICNPLIIGFHDLAGTGREKCLVAIINFRTLCVISGLTGEICWSYRFDRKTVMLSHNRMKTGRIVDSLPGEQITVWPEGDDSGYLFSFEQGIRDGRLFWQARGIGIGDQSRYNPNILVGDLTGDGQKSIIVIQHSVIWIVSPDSGLILAEIAGPQMRNYGFAGIFDADHDGKPELVLVNDAVQLHVAVIKLVGRQYVYLWDKYLGYGENVMKTPYLPVNDLDGDGMLEIIYSLGDVKANEWRIEILDAANGQLKQVIPDARVLDCADVDGDGQIELLLEKTVTSELVVLRWAAEGATELFTTQAAIQARPGLVRPLDRSHIASNRGNRFFSSLAECGRPGLLVQEAGLTRAFCCQDDSRITSCPVTIVPAAMLGSRADVPVETPIVTDLDGDGQMEIILGGQVYVVNGSKAGSSLIFVEKWDSILFDRQENVFFNSQAGIHFLAAWDFDGDGRKELLFGGSNAELIMTSCTGQVIWRQLLKGDFKGGRIMSCSIGRFLIPEQYDIFANVAATADYINECMVLESCSGRIVWRRSDGHDSGMGPVDGYAAVRGLEDDGLDDLLFLSGEVIAQIDGRTGRNLLEMTALGDLLGTRWIGSGQFTLIDVDQDGEDEIFLSGVWGLNGGVLKWQDHNWRPVWFDYYGNATPIGTPPRFSHQGFARSGGRILAGGPRSDYSYGCVDAASGELLWTYPLGDSLVGETCTGDIDGDGQDEFVFGCNDGFIYALKPDGTLLFRIFAGSPPGNPILADADGDGLLEILVTTIEGKLLLIG